MTKIMKIKWIIYYNLRNIVMSENSQKEYLEKQLGITFRVNFLKRNIDILKVGKNKLLHFSNTIISLIQFFTFKIRFTNLLLWIFIKTNLIKLYICRLKKIM